MTTPIRHYHDEIQDWLDGRLAPEVLADLERHLAACPECQRDHAAMGWIKREASRRLPMPEVPEELRNRIVMAIRAERPLVTVPQSPALPPSPVFQPGKNRLWLGAVAALLLVSLAVTTYWFRPLDMPKVAVRDFQSYQAERIKLEFQTGDVRQMEGYFQAHGVAFNTRVFDLAMMNFRLVGGRIQGSGRSARALFVYQGPAAHRLICQMYLGRVGDLPAGAVLSQHKGFTFHRFESNGVTAVFWQEGAVVCVLASDLAPEEVVQLAVAKAMV